MGKYTQWMDELLRSGITLSEFKRLRKEKLPGVGLSLRKHVEFRRRQGYEFQIEERDGDVYYRMLDKKEEKEKGEEKEKEKRERRLVGIGMYKLVYMGEVVLLEFKWNQGVRKVGYLREKDVKQVLAELLGAEIEIVSEVEVKKEVRGLFKVYA